LGEHCSPAISQCNWIDRVIGEAAEKVGWMVNKEASQGLMVEGQYNPNEDVDTITGLARMYLWWIYPRA
jgi:hypothetical protein